MKQPPMTQKFGFVTDEGSEPIKAAMAHPDTLFKAMFDRQALWDPATIDKVLETFPKGYIDESDLFLILAECIANSVLHGQADLLGFHARVRSGVLLLSFYQMPRMQQRVSVVLSLARSGKIRECTADLPGGLGFPILLKLAHNVTISNDYNSLQLWVRLKKP